jgi:RES domain-containing protein
VYFNDSPSLAVLEKLVHLDPDFMNDDYLLGAFEIDVSAVVVEKLTGFPANWRHDAASTAACGARWLAGNTGSLLSVPSAIVPEQRNFLMNPVHPDAMHLRTKQKRRFQFDLRLLPPKKLSG